MSAFAGLRALRHFDLQLFRADEIQARHAETSGRDLFDGAVFRVAVRFENVTRRIFAAFAGVAFAADAVHRDGQRFVRFLADRAVGHRAGFEAFQDGFDRFNFFDGNRPSLV